ncbi:MAG: hypothetical protein KF791_10835 [Verrucomicrobiae bacterium]|nr:hypothetical protein [Verrucomicrobiae bacterium]
MPEPDLIELFVRPLAQEGVRYFRDPIVPVRAEHHARARVRLGPHEAPTAELRAVRPAQGRPATRR